MASIEQSYHYNVVRRAIDLIDGSWGKGPLSRREAGAENRQPMAKQMKGAPSWQT
ncbi:MAG: hypothetical protein GDA40_04705 [Rhodobacteraceae bacterium]|nr:hypothetical protein [Paracoccaceae bacterium]